jgi:hypothetical protein
MVLAERGFEPAGASAPAETRHYEREADIIARLERVAAGSFYDLYWEDHANFRYLYHVAVWREDRTDAAPAAAVRGLSWAAAAGALLGVDCEGLGSGSVVTLTFGKSDAEVDDPIGWRRVRLTLDGWSRVRAVAVDRCPPNRWMPSVDGASLALRMQRPVKGLAKVFATASPDGPRLRLTFDDGSSVGIEPMPWLDDD